MSKPWLCYIIYDTIGCRLTYVGATTNFVRRLRQHNGEIVGGANGTHVARGDWRCICLITGFQSRGQTLQFEWAVKHGSGVTQRGIEGRMKKLRAVLHKEQWTKKAPPADSVPLCIHWHEHKFRPLDLRLPPYITEEFPVLDADSDKLPSDMAEQRLLTPLAAELDAIPTEDRPQLSAAA